MNQSVIRNLSIIGFLTVVIGYSVILFFLKLAPINTYNQIDNLVKTDSAFGARYDSLGNIPELAPLVKEKLFKNALLLLSDSDSIQLVIDLVDSSACLYLNGVRIHRSPLQKFSTDKVMQQLPMMHYTYLFAAPMPIIFQNASIVKEPIVERHAPKDTAEAAQQAYKPDTLIQAPAFLEFGLNGNISLIFEQIENALPTDQKARKQFLNAIKKREFKQNMALLRQYKPAQHQPTIVIELPANDLRAIYRALPQNAFVVLRY
jgi:hypothetical protein